MPIYEYRCKSCGQTFEVIQKFSDGPLRKCKECSGPLEKLISRSSFQLKGGGWFISDYARGSRGSAKGGKSADGEAKPSAAPSKPAGDPS